MSDDSSAVLGLPYILPNQAQKHVTHNEALRTLDVLVQMAVASRQLAAPPGAPQQGDRYIVAAGAGGDWAGQAGRIAVREAGYWSFHAPQSGWVAHVTDEGGPVTWDGAAWTSAAERALRVARLGVATDADATNRLAVAGPATLLTHGGTGGHQVKVNKAAPGDTASLLFQTGFSGRAEIGLAGDDALSVKVSADGSAWATALSAEPATGAVSVPAGLRAGAGSAAAPGVGFAAEAGLGLFRPAAGQLSLAAGGAEVLRAEAAHLRALTALHLADGTAGAPSLAFGDDPDTGLRRPAANQIGLVTGGVQRALVGTAALQLDLPVTGTAVLSTATDTTAGRLVRTGDYGLGTAIALGAGDSLDALAAAGFYYNPSTANTTGNSYPVSSAGALLNLRRTATNWVQLFVAFAGTTATAANARTFLRSQGGNGWSPWVELFHQGTILGAVSQAGGVPTGRVIERGTNANGDFVRFADGTQICTATRAAVACTTAQGTMWMNDTLQTWTFPAAFVAAPVVSGGAGGTSRFLGVAVPQATSASYRVLSPFNDSTLFAPSLVATGRWF